MTLLVTPKRVCGVFARILGHTAGTPKRRWLNEKNVTMLAVLFCQPRLMIRCWYDTGVYDELEPFSDTAGFFGRIERVLDAMGDMIVSEDRIIFLSSYHAQLRHCRPIDLLTSEDEFETVMKLLYSAESGSFA